MPLSVVQSYENSNSELIVVVLRPKCSLILWEVCQPQIPRSAVRKVLQYRDPHHGKLKMLAVMDRRR